MEIKLFLVVIMMMGAASADVIMPDSHPVTHVLYIDNLAEYGDYEFFIFPTHMTENVSEGHAFLTSSKVPGFYKFAGAKLYAVKKTDMGNRTIEDYSEDALESEDPLVVISSLPDSDNRTEIETHYEVAISNGRLSLSKVSETDDSGGRGGSPHTSGSEEDYVLPLVALGVGLLVGYVAGKKL